MAGSKQAFKQEVIDLVQELYSEDMLQEQLSVDPFKSCEWPDQSNCVDLRWVAGRKQISMISMPYIGPREINLILAQSYLE